MTDGARDINKEPEKPDYSRKLLSSGKNRENVPVNPISHKHFLPILEKWISNLEIVTIFSIIFIESKEAIFN